VAFASPLAAVRAAVAAQRGLAAHDWPAGLPVRVRMGLHTGDGVLGGDDYVGLDVNRSARIAGRPRPSPRPAPSSAGRWADGAPTAGPPPYQVYEVTPTTAFAFGKDESFSPTRWRFEATSP
jgi:hypothetical protein